MFLFAERDLYVPAQAGRALNRILFDTSFALSALIGGLAAGRCDVIVAISPPADRHHGLVPESFQACSGALAYPGPCARRRGGSRVACGKEPCRPHRARHGAIHLRACERNRGHLRRVLRNLVKKGVAPRRCAFCQTILTPPSCARVSATTVFGGGIRSRAISFS